MNINQIHSIMIASLTQAEITSFKAKVDAEEKSKTQTLDTTKYTQHNNHSDKGSHSDRTTHTDDSSYSHSDKDTHTDSGGHTDAEGGTHSQSDNDIHYQNHSDSHSDGSKHTNNGSESGHHNKHVDAVGRDYSQSAHNDKYTQKHTNTDNHKDSSTHTDKDVHRDRDSHSDADTHSNTTPHTDTGFDHSNYIPSKPQLYNIINNTKIRANTDLLFYSYDANNNNLGTQDTQSKTVKYLVRIRQTKTIAGVAKVSAWRTLVNYTTANSYTLNTVDPLGVGNTNERATEGVYEIEVTAINDTKTIKGVTKSYVSPTQITTVEIRQNQDPTIAITNPNEILKFYFGNRGATTEGGVFKTYDEGLYRDAKATEKHGLFITVSMNDADKASTSIRNYQKAKVHLTTSAGALIAGTEVEVTWDSTGNKIVSAEGVAKTGRAFIPKEAYLKANATGVKVVVTVEDFLDAACTNSAGAKIVQSTVSSTDTRATTINVDYTNPAATITGNPTEWSADDVKLAVTATDTGSGIKRIQTPDGVWHNLTNLVYTVKTNGTYKFIVEDKSGNQRTYSVVVNRIDKYPPEITFSKLPDDYVNDKVIVKITAKDTESGIKNMTLPNGTVVNQSVYDYTFTDNGTYTVKAEDVFGNVTTEQITIKQINKSVKVNNFSMQDESSKSLQVITYKGIKTSVVKKDSFSARFDTKITDKDKNLDRVQLTVKVTDIDTNKEPFKLVREKLAMNNKDILDTVTEIWFTDADMKNWEDGVYKLEVIVEDFKPNLANPSVERVGSVSSDKKEYYILVKRNKPPEPVITLKKENIINTINIQYPDEKKAAFNHPDIKKNYKYEYSIGYDNYLPYTGEIPITSSNTVYARVTDIVGNTTVSILNVELEGNGNGVNPTKPIEVVPGDGNDNSSPIEGTIDVKVEETRSSTTRYINTRKTTDQKIKNSIFDFLK